MRLAEASDRASLERMISIRALWMRARGLRGWEGWLANGQALAAQAGDPSWPLWVMLSGGRIVGQTTLLDGQRPSVCWTAPEKAELAISMHSTVTDPQHAGRGLGAAMASWALDHAARRPVRWVRRTVGPDERLVQLYQAQGWTVVRQTWHGEQPCWLLQCAAQRQPGLDGLVVEQPRTPGGHRSGSRAAAVR
jgi:GNAT superfamily N-acetyltransferase